MDKNSTRKCCGGKAYSRGYSTEPELIDLKPFKMEASLRYEQNQKHSDKYKVTCKRIEAKVNKRRRQAVLTPLFKLLEHLDHSDPNNADIIANIKSQLVTLAKDPSQVEVCSAATPNMSQSPESEWTRSEPQDSSHPRHPSAFILASAQNSPSTISRAPSTPRVLPRGSTASPCSITLEDESELDGVRGSSCDEIFNYILGMIKSIIPRHTREEIEQLENRSAEPVATHNHPAHQRCGPSCWAYDALDITRTHNYLNESTPRSSVQSSAPQDSSPIMHTLPNTSYVTTSMRVPLEYAQY